MPAAYRASAQVFGTTSSTSITIPATVQAGDMLVLQAAGGYAPFVPSGWAADFTDASSSNIRCFVAHRFADVTDAGKSLTITWEAGYNHVINLVAVSGVSAVRSSSNMRSSSGNSAATGPLTCATDDVIVYLGGIRQASGLISVDRGTTDMSARDSSNNFSGIIAHESITSDGYIGANFSSTGGAGYLYSEIVLSSGSPAPSYAVVSSDYVEVLAAGTPATRVEANYVEVLAAGFPSTQVESSYVEVLSGGLPKVQVETNYLEILTNSPAMRTETVYAEVLATGIPLLQAETVYAEIITTADSYLQTSTAYAEVITTADSYLQTSTAYAEVISSVQKRIKGWGIIK